MSRADIKHDAFKLKQNNLFILHIAKHESKSKHQGFIGPLVTTFCWDNVYFKEAFCCFWLYFISTENSGSF